MKGLWMCGCKIDHKYEFKSMIGNNNYVSWQIIIGRIMDVI